MAIDYELLLSEGILGIIKMIDDYLLTCDKEMEPFYKCCKRCLQAVMKHSENYSDLALKMSHETADPTRRNELEKIAEICKKVPAHPAESFYEAVQSVHFNETLKKAQKNPEEYRDLVVRIGGYSDYFVRLSPEMQEEVIVRTTHNV